MSDSMSEDGVNKGGGREEERGRWREGGGEGGWREGG